MGRRNLKRSQKRAIQIGLFYHYVTVIAITAAAVVLCVLIWYFMAPGHSRVHHVQSAETVSITAAPRVTQAARKNRSSSEKKEEEEYKLTSPEKEDGTGEAGTMRVTDGRTVSSGLGGWQVSEDGRWFEVTKDVCYYGGYKKIGEDTFFFDKNGYTASGWVVLSYQNGAYFDSEGRLVEDKDKSKMLALTFEGGPTDYTSDVLDLLSEYGAKATFFLLGSNIDARNDLLNRIISLGHNVGNITYSGEDLSGADAETVMRAFGDTDELIDVYSTLGRAEVIRFPNGNYTREDVLIADRPQILFDCESYDYEVEDPNQIAQNIFSQLQGGMVIRMHDQSQSTLDALKILLPDLIAQGYEFVNIKDMAASRGYKLENGVTYLGFKQSDVDAKMVNDL